MISISGITKKFGKLAALNKVSAEFRKGECIALLGPNGSGKTTLIKCILGMVVQDSGDILFDCKNIRNDFQYREHIGYMPQIGKYPENMTIGQVFNMMKNIRKKENSILNEELYHGFGIDQLLDKRMRTLSGGTTQKVSASLAFLFDPQVLILDEPTAGLDPMSAELLKEKIRKEKEKGKLILITSHVLSELDELVTGIVYMQEGNIKFHKTIKELTDESGEKKLSKAIAHVMLNKTT